VSNTIFNLKTEDRLKLSQIILIVKYDCY